jgi:hypothetical protein
MKRIVFTDNVKGQVMRFHDLLLSLIVAGLLFIQVSEWGQPFIGVILASIVVFSAIAADR